MRTSACVFVVFALGCAGACSGGPASTPKPTAPTAVASASPSGVVAAEQTASCTPVKDGSPRSKGIEALAEGRGKAATVALRAAIEAHPEDLTAQVLLIAARKKQEKLSLDVEAGLRTAVPIPLQITKSSTFVDNAVEPRPGADAVRLKTISESKNLIVDVDDWLKKNGVSSPTLRPGPEDIPEHLPRTFQGVAIQQIHDHGDHQIGVFGAALVVGSPDSALVAFTLMNGPTGSAPPDFAQVVGSTLLVATRTYQSGSQPYTTLLAFDVNTGALKWASDRDVSNARTFAVTRDHVVVGFGGSAMPDNLFLIDLANGKTLQKLPIKSGPDLLLLKDDRLLVRSYDVDYAFGFSTPPAPRVAPALPSRKGASHALSAPARCALDAAVAASDARDVGKLQDAVHMLTREKADPLLVGAFEGTVKFFEQQQQKPALDLTMVSPTRVDEPAWEYRLTESAGPAPTGTAKLVKASSQQGGNPWIVRRGKYDPQKPWPIAPFEKGKLPPGARVDIPSQYGMNDLRVIIPSGDRLLLVYGGRYVAVIKGTETEAVFDLETFRHPPKVNPQWKEFAVGDVTYALAEGDTLYVANGGGSYAREMMGKKGFVSAFSISKKKLLWRSQPLVHGTGPFSITSDYLATGYGFTDEADNVFLLRKDTGAVAAKLPLESAPDEVSATGDRLRVFAYDRTYDIEVRR
ncbi:MAG: hypothetical protein HOW73_15290 [Polyangiaceae bacterium]|nr:hypothetical protein [Polyangiaceae bacterium]